MSEQTQAPGESSGVEGSRPPTPATLGSKQPVVGKGAVIVLIVAVIAVMLVAWFKDDIVSFWRLKPWDKASPCAFVDSVNDALKAGDAATLKSLLGGEGAIVNVEDGKITTIKPKAAAPQQPPMEASQFVFTGKAQDGKVEFMIDPVRPSVGITLPSEQGVNVVYGLTRDEKGDWQVGNLFTTPK